MAQVKKQQQLPKSSSTKLKTPAKAAIASKANSPATTAAKTLVKESSAIDAKKATSGSEIMAKGHHQEAMAEILEQPYELVKPMDFFRRDTWLGDGGRTPVGRRWWKQKKKPQQKMTVVRILIIFSVILAVIFTLIGVGAFFVAKRWRALKSRLDPRLTTKMALCRSQYEEVSSECIAEDVAKYRLCESTERVCIRMAWTFTHQPKETHFVGGPTSQSLDDSDFADCIENIQHRYWCQNGVCEPSDVVSTEQWWPSKAFLDKTGKMVVRALQKEADNPLPCLEVPDAAKPAFANLVSWYIGGCGMSACPEFCNVTMCDQSNGLAKFGLRVELYHCELKLDTVTGVRSAHCTQPMVRVIHCHHCAGFDSKQEVKKKDEFASHVCGSTKRGGSGCGINCDNGKSYIFPDGTPCRFRKGVSHLAFDGVCLMGSCYEVSSDADDVNEA